MIATLRVPTPPDAAGRVLVRVASPRFEGGPPRYELMLPRAWVGAEFGRRRERAEPSCAQVRVELGPRAGRAERVEEVYDFFGRGARGRPFTWRESSTAPMVAAPISGAEFAAHFGPLLDWLFVLDAQRLPPGDYWVADAPLWLLEARLDVTAARRAERPRRRRPRARANPAAPPPPGQLAVRSALVSTHDQRVMERAYYLTVPEARMRRRVAWAGLRLALLPDALGESSGASMHVVAPSGEVALDGRFEPGTGELAWDAAKACRDGVSWTPTDLAAVLEAHGGVSDWLLAQHFLGLADGDYVAADPPALR